MKRTRASGRSRCRRKWVCGTTDERSILLSLHFRVCRCSAKRLRYRALHQIQFHHVCLDTADKYYHLNQFLREIAYNWLLYLVETVIGRRFAFDKDYASKCDQQYENKFILGALAITRWDEAEESGTSASKCMAWQQRACHTSLNSLEDPEDPGGFYLTHHHVESRVFRMFGFLPDRHNARP
jgi:hypothetical protein